MEYIARAAGAGPGKNGFLYSNALSILEYNYEKQFRTFEIDLSSTSDDRFVCVHDWTRYNLLYKRDAVADATFANHIPSYEEFMYDQFGSYRSRVDMCDVAHLTTWLTNHKDAKIVLDMENPTAARWQTLITEIAETNDSPDLLDRIIPKVYGDPSTIAAFMALHKWPRLHYVLDDLTDATFEYFVNNELAIQNFVVEAPYWDFQQAKAQLDKFQLKGIKTCAFTATDCVLADLMQEAGADMVYSDYNCANLLAPGNFDYKVKQSFTAAIEPGYHISFPFDNTKIVSVFHFVIGAVVGMGTVNFLRTGIGRLNGDFWNHWVPDNMLQAALL